jgi:hypothetical protein
MEGDVMDNRTLDFINFIFYSRAALAGFSRL